MLSHLELNDRTDPSQLACKAEPNPILFVSMISLDIENVWILSDVLDVIYSLLVFMLIGNNAPKKLAS